MRSSWLFFPIWVAIHWSYHNFLPVSASHDTRSLNQNIQNAPVRIGLLITSANAMSARNGAEMAIHAANEKGGYRGRPFALVVRSIEGPWGAGSKEAVNLIFNENVCALIGSHDGRNAHLVEQVSAKARIVFLSAWTADPTLSQAFVPWYFSCVPNDLQQADALIDEIYNKRNLTKIAVVSEDDYDAKLSLNSLSKKVRSAGHPLPREFYYDPARPDFKALAAKIEKAGVNAIILYGKPEATVAFIKQLRNDRMRQPVFGNLSASGDKERIIYELEKFENIFLISSGLWKTKAGQTFARDYRQIYGVFPDAVSAYSFDGTNLILEAVKKAGPDREKIQKALLNVTLDGTTGMIRFDNKGNRTGNILLTGAGTLHPLNREDH